MDQYFPKVLCEIINDYAEDFFEPVEMMLSRTVRLNEETQLWEVDSMRNFISYHAHTISISNPTDYTVIKLFTERIRRIKLLKYARGDDKAISNADRSRLSRGYIVAMSKFLQKDYDCPYEGASLAHFELMPRIRKYYKNSKTFNVMFFGHKVAIPLAFFKELCYHLATTV